MGTDQMPLFAAEDFQTPFGGALDAGNRWARQIPWHELVAAYHESLKAGGAGQAGTPDGWRLDHQAPLGPDRCRDYRAVARESVFPIFLRLRVLSARSGLCTDAVLCLASAFESRMLRGV